MHGQQQYIFHVLYYQFQLNKDLIILFFGSIHWPVPKSSSFLVCFGVNLSECPTS